MTMGIGEIGITSGIGKDEKEWESSQSVFLHVQVSDLHESEFAWKLYANAGKYRNKLPDCQVEDNCDGFTGNLLDVQANYYRVYT